MITGTHFLTELSDRVAINIGVESIADRSEGLDPNGICYPCVMGWGLAGTGNSSAVAVVAAVAPQNVCFLRNGFLRERVEYERSWRDTTAVLIVRTLRFFSRTLKKCENPKTRQKKNTVYLYVIGTAKIAVYKYIYI